MQVAATSLSFEEIDAEQDRGAVVALVIKILDNPEGSDLFGRTEWHPRCELFTESIGTMEGPIVVCQQGNNGASVLLRVDFFK